MKNAYIKKIAETVCALSHGVLTKDIIYDTVKTKDGKYLKVIDYIELNCSYKDYAYPDEKDKYTTRNITVAAIGNGFIGVKICNCFGYDEDRDLEYYFIFNSILDSEKYPVASEYFKSEFEKYIKAHQKQKYKEYKECCNINEFKNKDPEFYRYIVEDLHILGKTTGVINGSECPEILGEFCKFILAELSDVISRVENLIRIAKNSLDGKI